MNRKVYEYDRNNVRMNYVVAYPDDVRELPLIVYLHGAGERGQNVSHLYRHGIPKLIEEGREIPAVLLFPQCPDWAVWDNVVTSVKDIIDLVVQEYGILPDRIMLTGSSMGGFGTWMLGLTYPNFFAALAPIAGGNMSWRASRLCNTPILAFHGALDKTVDPIYSRLMVDEIQKKGGNATLRILENHGHNDGINYAYSSTDLIPWLLEQRRTNFDRIPEPFEQYF